MSDIATEIIDNITFGVLDKGPSPAFHDKAIRELPKDLYVILMRYTSPIYSVNEKMRMLVSLQIVWERYDNKTRKHIRIRVPRIARGLDGLSKIDYKNNPFRIK